MSAADMGSWVADAEIIPDVCPHSTLPIQSRPEWVYTNPKGTYRTTIALIGEAIFWVIPRGYVTEADMVAATALAAEILAETHPTRTPFVFIENFGHTKGGTIGARRRYLRYTNSLEGLLGSFPYGMPPFFRLSFNFSRRLDLHRYRVHMVPRYENALQAALDMLRRHGIFAGEPVSPKALFFSGRPLSSAADEGQTDQRIVSDAEHCLACSADALLAYLGSLDLESPGVPDPPTTLAEGPLGPIFEALAMLKLDMDHFLAEHQLLMADLQDRQHQLLDRSNAIEGRNRELEGLLQKVSEDQAALGKTVRRNVETLLKPVLQLIRRDVGSPSASGAFDRLDVALNLLIEDLCPPVDLQDYRLTPRERRIARLIRDGEHSAAIARRLGVSARTVASFRGRLRDKLGIRGQPRNLRTVLQALPEE